MNDALEIIEGAVGVRDGRIISVGPEPDEPFDTTIDAGGAYLLPGFVQTHIHLCQTLFRGFADDMPLLDWLKRRVWPLEAAHTPSTLRASARVASAELLLSGTTTVLTMETVHDTDVVFEALAESGMRAVVGKCMMDSADGVPPRLREKTRASIDESLALMKRWNGAANGRLRAAFAPRFAVSCSRELLEAVGQLSRERQALIHTHASENRDEVEVVRQLSGGFSNLEYLADTGLAGPHLCAAHCVWVTDAEQALIAERDVKVLHCPGSNLKLGSGIAPVAKMRRNGICVQQPPRHVRGDSPGRGAPGRPRGAGGADRAGRHLHGDPGGSARAGPGRRDRLDRGGQTGRPHPRRPGPPAPGTGRGSLVDAGLRGPGVGCPSDDGGRRDPGVPGATAQGGCCRYCGGGTSSGGRAGRPGWNLTYNDLALPNIEC
jgi:imidazolonepropionase-like amidohydrolase